MKKTIYSIVLISALLTACSGYKIETFYIGEGGMQYFLPPIEFESKSVGCKMDFTYKFLPGKYFPVTFNFSLFYDKGIDEISKAFFVLDNDTVKVDNLRILFKEHEKNTIRYASELDTAGFHKIFSHEKPVFFAGNKDRLARFEPTCDFGDAAERVIKSIIPNASGN